MSARCARCGDCCAPVLLAPDRWEYAASWNTARLAGIPDPATDDGWEYWKQHGFTDDQREDRINHFHADHRSADFITGHWTVVGEQVDGGRMLELSCDRFDSRTRLCMAHDDRPPICSGYPWYGRDPDAATMVIPGRCSFLGDLPPAERPAGSRPLLPLTVL